MRCTIVALLTVTAALTLPVCGDEESGSGDNGRTILATTTSTQDSGLLDELLPRFRRNLAAR
jgi:tungstate transport system substrate-binding protein